MASIDVCCFSFYNCFYCICILKYFPLVFCLCIALSYKSRYPSAVKRHSCLNRMQPSGGVGICLSPSGKAPGNFSPERHLGLWFWRRFHHSWWWTDCQSYIHCRTTSLEGSLSDTCCKKGIINVDIFQPAVFIVLLYNYWLQAIFNCHFYKSSQRHCN